MRKATGLLFALSFGLAAATASAGAIRAFADGIPDQYIVVLREGAARSGSGPIGDGPSVAEVADDLAKPYGVSPKNIYEHALLGFSARMPEAVAEALASDPRVEYVEQDTRMHTGTVQPNATWNLDRIDQRDLPVSSQYVYNETAGNVHAYIIDSGIRATHVDFGGRASGGETWINDGRGTGDCLGHGTHVSGLLGGATYGVAKQVQLHPLRVFGCQGQGDNSDIIAAVDWAKANHASPAVVNMSLGGPPSDSLDTAVRNLVQAGVTVVVAAGNESQNACNRSPARVAEAMTVGATDPSDIRPGFSNFGPCLDLFAPGDVILSDGIQNDTDTAYYSGTSQATPHVAGVAALHLGDHPGDSPAQVANAILSTATSGRVINPGSGSPNLLVYSILSGGGGSPPGAPVLTAPPDGAWTSQRPVLDWNAVNANPPVEHYQIQVRRVSDNAIVHDKVVGVGSTDYTVPANILADKVSYKWRVRAQNAPGWGAWSGYRTFLVRVFVKVDLGTNDAEDGLQRPNPEPSDGETGALTITNACNNNNVVLRQNLGLGGTVGGTDRFLYFQVDDRFAFKGSYPSVEFSVDFWDRELSGWSPQLCIQYQTSGNLYKQAGCVTVNNTRCLRNYTVAVTDAYFGNGENGGADFRIVAGTGDTRRYVNIVRVTKK